MIRVGVGVVMSVTLLLSTVLTSITLSQALSTPQDKTYVAGVVEYFKIRHEGDPKRETAENLANYVRLIESPEAQTVDILVFPESTLNNHGTPPFIPDPEDEKVPCGDPTADPLLENISCAAQKTKKYVVINLTEKSLCPDRQQIRLNDTRPCPDDKIIMYNANVVFDRNGRIISKYRKVNLFGELDITSPIQPESVPFDTDFGVKFGQFICFDLMFDRPALDLVKQGVTDFVFPTMWFSEIPFLAAVQPQQAWAYKHNVNFLGAGASWPGIGSTGSGIYHGKAGALQAVMAFRSETKMYIATVPKIGSGELPKAVPPVQHNPTDMLGLYLKRDQLDVYTTQLVKTDGPYSTELCHGNWCCQFTVEVEFRNNLLTGALNEEYYFYRLAAYSGVRTFDGFADGGVKVCAVIACTNDSLKSCGTRFARNKTIVEVNNFKVLTISARYNNQDNLLVIPNTLSTSILPLPVDDIEYTENAESETLTKATISLKNPKANLYTFSIYSRNFALDAWPDNSKTDKEKDDTGSSTIRQPLIGLIVTLLLFFMYVH